MDKMILVDSCVCQCGTSSPGNVAVNELLLHVAHHLCYHCLLHEGQRRVTSTVDGHLKALLDLPDACVRCGPFLLLHQILFVDAAFKSFWHV